MVWDLCILMPKNIHKDTHSSKNPYADAFNSLKEVWASALLFGAVFFFLSLFTCNKADLTGYTTLGTLQPP
ncbi:hypothetical protein KDK77_10770, partial [bacterium]|nr:hypothetical protein [bacterium]